MIQEPKDIFADAILPRTERRPGRIRIPRKYLGVASIVVACLSIAVANVTTKSFLAELPVFPIIFVQLVTSTVVVWVLAVTLGQIPRGRLGIKLGLIGILHPGMTYVFSFLGLATTQVSVQGFLFSSESAMVAVLAFLLLREKISITAALSIAFGIVGVVLLSTPTFEVIVPSVGICLILLGVSCSALDTIVCRVFVAQADPLSMTAACHVTALAVAAVAVYATGPYSWAFVGDFSTLAIIAGSGVLLHGVAVFFMNLGLVTLTASHAALLFPLITVFSTLGGYIFLGEELSLVQLIGGLLLIGSALTIALFEYRGSQTETAVE